MVVIMSQIICRKIKGLCGKPEGGINFFDGRSRIAYFGECYVINYNELPDSFILDRVYSKRLVYVEGYYEPRLESNSKPYTPIVFNIQGNIRLEHVFIQLKEVL